MQQINQNYFQLFDLSESFDLDLGKLSEKYHARQVEVHPDKFSGATEKDKLRAVQLTSYLNEAYSTLKAPIKRAAYLLTINGLNVESVSQNDLGMDLLLEQMQLRESLDALPKDESALKALGHLKSEVGEKLNLKQNNFSREFASGELTQAKRIFHELQFLHKLLLEIEAGEEQRLGY